MHDSSAGWFNHDGQHLCKHRALDPFGGSLCMYYCCDITDVAALRHRGSVSLVFRCCGNSFEFLFFCLCM